MISLERIVRPYQRPAALTYGRFVSRPVAPSTDIAVLTWGNVGTLPTPVQEDVPAEGVDFTVEVCDTGYQETSREVQPIKVTQPDKPENYFVIERIKSMSFRVNEKAKNAGVIRTASTSFPDIGFGESAFGAVQKADNCKSTFNLSGT